MKVIGLTGGTGSGKSVVAGIFSEKGYYIIDADKIGHNIILKGKKAYFDIIEFFGEEILDDEKNIIRKKLGEIVFSDKTKLDFLNKCTHGHIKNEIIRLIDAEKNNNHTGIIIDAALLFEAGINHMCSEVVAVIADDNIRINRIMARDFISEEVAKKRMYNQMSNQQYIEKSDVVIDNSKDLDHIRRQIEDFN